MNSADFPAISQKLKLDLTCRYTGTKASNAMQWSWLLSQLTPHHYGFQYELEVKSAMISQSFSEQKHKVSVACIAREGVILVVTVT